MRFQSPDLPVSSFLPEIARALAGGSLVLEAETGAGKTTVIPAALAASGALSGRMIVLEPRRLAARAAAAQAARLLGESVGRTVGYRVRGDSRVGPSTVVEYVTEAVFLRMVQDDPLLDGVALAVFDEFHGRSWVADLSLAFAAEARRARPELSLLAMSATMLAGKAADYLECPSLSVPGRAFPVRVEHRPPAGAEPVGHFAGVIMEALAETSGDVLAFVPGAREAAAAESALRRLGARADILFLHGGLGLDAQAAVVSPPTGSRRRVVLATAVAETSLTVPRVGAVVDLGLSRFTRYHGRSGINRLVTERVSRAEAEQRRGRAGRLGPGVCYRCWDASDILEPDRGPEILRAELSSLVLECAARGVRSPGSMRWLDPPPPGAWEDAAELLRGLGLTGRDGTITPRGVLAVGLGADARPAAALAAAAESGSGGARPPAFHAAALAAALMGERAATDADLRASMEAALAETRREGSAADEAERLCRRAAGIAFDQRAAAAALDAVGDALAPGFPDRLARFGDDGLWELRSGRKAKAGEVGRAARPGDWILAVDLDAGDRLGTVYRAVPVGEAAARLALAQASSESLEPEWRGLSCSAWLRVKSGAFTLKETRLPETPPDILREACRARFAGEGLSWLPWDEDASAFVERVRYAARLGALPETLDGEWSERGMAEWLPEAIGPYLRRAGPAIDAAGLGSALRDRLGGQDLATLEREAPAFVPTPGGRKRRPSYPARGEARLALRIQEAFGMRQSPPVCGRPLVLELLSPADRPLQATADLASFWSGAYPRLRAELARRYPKHHWPEDPLAAELGRGLAPRGATPGGRSADGGEKSGGSKRPGRK